MTNNTELVEYLLSHGKANPNASDRFKRTPLHIAASRGYSSICEILIRYGANPNSKDSLGNTPLHLAACACNIPVCTALVNGGALSIVDSNDRFPFDLALSKYKLRYPDVASRLSQNDLSITLTRLHNLLYPNVRDKALHEDDLKNLLQSMSLNE